MITVGLIDNNEYVCELFELFASIDEEVDLHVAGPSMYYDPEFWDGIDMALVDYSLDVGSGLEVARWLLNRGVKVYIHTAYDRSSIKVPRGAKFASKSAPVRETLERLKRDAKKAGVK